MTSAMPPSSVGPAPNNRLNGWKEIAAHFGRGVRTVQRWEKAFGMPVYRIGAGRGENVHAFSQELDAWLATATRSRDFSDQPGDPEAPGAEPRSEGGGPPPAGAQDSAVPAEAQSALTSVRRGPAVFRARWLAVAATVLALGGTFAWLASRPSAPQPSLNLQVDARRQPTSAKAAGDTLLVYDAEGQFLWRRRFNGPLPFNTDDPPTRRGRKLRFEDVNGDGIREVLVFAPTTNSGWPTTLYCLSGDGRELWTRTVTKSVRFGDTEYSAPWSGHWMFVTGTSATPALWVTWIHVESGFFPCLVERLAGKDGQPLSEYWSAGYVELISDGTLQGRSSILVGGANNDHVGGSLAIFDADAVTGSAPAESPDKTCRDCRPGGPRAFLVFPQLELSRLSNGFPSVFDARIAETGELSVWVNHQSPNGEGIVSYQLDKDLRPVRAELGSGYLSVHKALEDSGRLTHRLGDRDRGELWPVLVYGGGRFFRVTGRTTR
jgi:hypothetical protein